MNARKVVVDAVLAELYADLLKLQRDLAQASQGQPALMADIKSSVEATAEVTVQSTARAKANNEALAAYVKTRADDVTRALTTHRDDTVAAVTAALAQGRTEARALLKPADDRAGRRFVALATLLICSVGSNLAVLAWLLVRPV